ncbi:aminotransferase class IV [Tenacibaculum sp. SZ-18]|uniref:aminotransferase class IV n=1 Tax=Tenacibaculum sp. SZ-18 TaxID=754423 RepID=UPI000C2D077D|nr:aminotransferase class IV [Tenacibaculum sp. SZ-18]AUC15396.1 aminotransferase class IV [Tenacibaculum sp. SZ-18]
MINYNGSLITPEELQLTHENRAFKYGDGIFETIKVQNGKIVFLEDHYFRLMASMRMLRMKIPMTFTLEFLEEQIRKTITTFDKRALRVRINVYRKDGGLYKPETNEIDFLIEVKEISLKTKSTYRIDLFKDFYNYSGLLSTVKTTNRMLNTIAAVYSDENDLDNCILLNERKGVVEVTNGNIFIVKDNVIKTPSINEGCIKGIIRKKVIEIIEKNPDYTLEETSISPFELQKADEVFITNAIVGIQPVTNYRKKEFNTEISEKIGKSLSVVVLTS